jgi:hypothetical protein
MRKFVQSYIIPYRQGQGENAGRQFAVLAFNLGVHGVAAPTLPSTNPALPNLSGPWVAVVEPGLGHPETQLARAVHDWIEAYVAAVGALPRSICLYTAMSPCRGCIEWLQGLPSEPLGAAATRRFGRFVFPKIWVLSFDRYYVATAEEVAAGRVYSDEHEPSWNYPFRDRGAAKGAVEEMRGHGWVIEWP